MSSKAGALRNVLPFSYLERGAREAAEQALTLRRFAADDIVFSRGDPAPTDQSLTLFVVRSGSFATVSKDGFVISDITMGPGSYFGERAALFGTPRTVEVRALEDSTAWELPGELVMDLLEAHNTRFALALSSNLRYKQGLFDHFLGFKSFVFSQLHMPVKRSIDMNELVERYRQLEPAIHRYCNDPHSLDFEGWGYALRRLPHNITRVYSIVCSRRVINVLKTRALADDGSVEEDIPITTCAGGDGDLCRSPDDLTFVVSSLSPGHAVLTDERRRTCWEVMPGKIFILLRELTSDYLDIVTNLCVHAIESHKLFHKMRPLGPAVSKLQRGVVDLERMTDTTSASLREREREILLDVSKGRLSREEVDGLLKLWPTGDVLQRVLDVLIHHGDFSFFLDSTNNAYTLSADERWCQRVRALAVKVIGEFDNHPDSDLVVDIISSNTHSVLNCLSPYIHKNARHILAWGRENAPHLFEPELTNEDDRLYPVTKLFFEANPSEKAAATRAERLAGIHVLLEREVTGISVQMYDINRLKAAGYGFDSTLEQSLPSRSPCKARHLLINIDYCFGGQAESIMQLLLLTFGNLVRSVNILGKAGGLTGSRGDILFPTHVLDENHSGEMKSLDNSDIDPAKLSEMSGRSVHVGPIITVLGTVLQSRELLRFYERLWHATGMEMELSFYVRAMEQASQLGIMPDCAACRMLYYVSDTPLQPSSSLATKMSVMEGVPPLYSITRTLLSRVLDVSELGTPGTTAGDRWRKVRNSLRATLGRPRHGPSAQQHQLVQRAESAPSTSGGLSLRATVSPPNSPCK